MIPTEELLKWKVLAEKATGGRWLFYPYKESIGMGIISNNPLPVMVARDVIHEKDVDYICSSSPENVIALINEVLELRKKED